MTALPQDEPDGSERRVAPRTRTLKRAQVLFNNRFSTFDCIVRNVSATGALLTIDASAHLPKTFDVRIGDEPERPAKLVYRRGILAGIHFLDGSSEEEDKSDFLHRDTAFGATAASGDFGPHDPFNDRAGLAPAALATIRRLVPEALPARLTRHFRWS